jgi:[glutamine synthetase] adenylyltransferase / [glutamine synthetase]-adenylyl-L-tyrosine phosphorylase
MSIHNLKDLLLAPRLDPDEAASLLRPYGFKDCARADANLQSMVDDPAARLLLAEILEELMFSLSESADPDRALNYFERFARAAVNRIHLFSYFKDSPRALGILAKTFGSSPYMAEILIRDPVYLYWATDSQNLDRQRKKREMGRDLMRALKTITSIEKRLDFLRAFKRKEMLHLGVRDLLRLCSVEETLDALSNLSEVLIDATCKVCEEELLRDYGAGLKRTSNFTVLGMGKLGGGELNFSSDVDLIYLYASDQEEIETALSGKINAAEYYRRLSQKITTALSDFTSEGYLYRVDLRLRPEGKLGNIAYSLDGFRRYYQARGETWERLALLKARPVAGNRLLGKRFIEMVRSFIYDQPFNEKALDDLRKLKQKIDQKITLRQQRRRDVKLGFGGIREIELIVQALQVSYGSRLPQIRERNTIKSLALLGEQTLISAQEHDTLKNAYIFLRDVENKLQMVNDAQTHAIPAQNEDLVACARMLGYSEDHPLAAAEKFLADYYLHTDRVNVIFENIFNADHPRRFKY